MTIPHDSGPTALVWLDADQRELIGSAMDVAGVRIVGAGSGQVGRATELAARLECRACDDLRAALVTTDADVVLLAAPGSFGLSADRGGGGAGAGDDLAALAACRGRGVRVLTLEPMPASVLQIGAAGMALGSGGGSPESPGGLTESGREWAAFCPLMRASRVVRDAAEVIAGVGPLHAVSLVCCSGAGEGSLGARLFDAMDMLVGLLGDPEQIDAAYAWPERERGGGVGGGGRAVVHPAPGETLRGLDGAISANVRFVEGRSAGVVVSNRAGRWERSLTLLGEHGRVRIDDHGLEWIGKDGRVVDSSRAEASAANVAAAHLAEQVVRALDPRALSVQPTDHARVLAAAGAALLSARTGEPESPATILRMAMGSAVG